MRGKPIATGEHVDKLEARRALHRKMRSLRLMVLAKKQDLTGMVFRHDGVPVWVSKMTPQSVLNPPVRWIIYQQVGVRETEATPIVNDIRAE